MTKAAFLTIDQLAKRWQLSPRTIERRVQAGEIPSLQIGGARRFSLQAIEEWERAQAEKDPLRFKIGLLRNRLQSTNGTGETPKDVLAWLQSKAPGVWKRYRKMLSALPLADNEALDKLAKLTRALGVDGDHAELHAVAVAEYDRAKPIAAELEARRTAWKAACAEGPVILMTKYFADRLRKQSKAACALAESLHAASTLLTLHLLFPLMFPVYRAPKWACLPGPCFPRLTNVAQQLGIQLFDGENTAINQQTPPPEPEPETIKAPEGPPKPWWKSGEREPPTPDPRPSE